LQEDSTVYTLKCNISVDVNYLHQGVALALVEDREKNSAQVGAALETTAHWIAGTAVLQHGQLLLQHRQLLQQRKRQPQVCSWCCTGRGQGEKQCTGGHTLSTRQLQHAAAGLLVLHW
jgi:hypothetical protein